jgi:hypothetical protein
MDAKWRFGATIVIWVFSFVLTVLALVGAAGESLDDWVIAIPMVIALVSTITIWESKNSKVTPPSDLVKQTDNTAYSMALLMEMMDDDEREEFKHNLKQRILSGENVTNESLILDMEKRKRG